LDCIKVDVFFFFGCRKELFGFFGHWDASKSCGTNHWSSDPNDGSLKITHQ
jgi:hypothetical protein